MYFFNYPAETPEAVKFWGSRHNANIAKAYVAFSLDKDNFIEIAKRAGFTRAWRDRVWEAFGQYVNQPDMVGIPFSEMSDLWWNEMPTPTLHQFNFPELVPTPQPLPEPESSWPKIISPLEDLTVTEGDVVTLSFDASDYDSIQWYKGNYEIEGEDGLTFTFTATNYDNGIQYKAKLTNQSGSLFTSSTITVKSGAPVITSQPVGGDEPSGTGLLLKVESEGDYQWQVLDRYSRWVDLENGNNSFYVAENLSPGKYTYFRVVVSNDYGSVISEEISVFPREGVKTFSPNLDGNGRTYISVPDWDVSDAGGLIRTNIIFLGNYGDDGVITGDTSANPLIYYRNGSDNLNWLTGRVQKVTIDGEEIFSGAFYPEIGKEYKLEMYIRSGAESVITTIAALGYSTANNLFGRMWNIEFIPYSGDDFRFYKVIVESEDGLDLDGTIPCSIGNNDAAYMSFETKGWVQFT